MSHRVGTRIAFYAANALISSVDRVKKFRWIFIQNIDVFTFHFSALIKKMSSDYSNQTANSKLLTSWLEVIALRNLFRCHQVNKGRNCESI